MFLILSMLNFSDHIMSDLASQRLIACQSYLPEFSIGFIGSLLQPRWLWVGNAWHQVSEEIMKTVRPDSKLEDIVAAQSQEELHESAEILKVDFAEQPSGMLRVWCSLACFKFHGFHVACCQESAGRSFPGASPREPPNKRLRLRG